MAENKEEDVPNVKEVCHQSHSLKSRYKLQQIHLPLLPSHRLCKDAGDNFPCLQASKITVQVKTPKEKQAVEIEENVTVRKVTRGSSRVSAE